MFINIKMTTVIISINKLLIALLLVIALPVTANAHALKETTARITLRDGQAEVRVRLDITRWQTKLQNNQAWLLGDIQQVMPLDITAKEKKIFIENILTSETLLILNNQKVPLTLLSISAPKNSQDHHDYSELILSSSHNIAVIEKLKIRFPKSLGAVHSSVVKPKYQLIPAGQSAEISL